VNAQPEHKTRLLEQFQKVRAKVGGLRIALPLDGVAILVDGVEAARTPVEGDVFTAPGTHTVEARKDGYRSASRSVTVEAGKSVAFTMALEKDESSASDPVGNDSKPIWPYITFGGVTALGIGLGIGLHVTSASKAEDAEGSVCPGDGETCPTAAGDAISGANGMLGGAIAGYTLAGLGVIGLIAYGAWSGPAQPETGIRIVPMVGPQVGGLHVTADF